MATINDQSEEGAGASDQPAANANTDLEAIVQRVVAAVTEQTDKRFQGFQSLMDKKLEGISRQFKTAGLSPEEQEQLDEEDSATELEELRRWKALADLRDKYPKGADLLAKLMRVDSMEAQAELIESLTPAEQAQVAEAIADAEATAGGATPVPEVDRNSPARPVGAGRVAAAAGQMNDDIADALLSQAGKGALARGG